MMTATNKFNICSAHKEINDNILWNILYSKLNGSSSYTINSYYYNRWRTRRWFDTSCVSVRRAYQKRAEKYERHKIHVGHVRTTIVVHLLGTLLAHFPMITRQHDRRPRFARGASVTRKRVITRIHALTWSGLKYFVGIT